MDTNAEIKVGRGTERGAFPLLSLCLSLIVSLSPRVVESRLGLTSGSAPRNERREGESVQMEAAVS